MKKVAIALLLLAPLAGAQLAPPPVPAENPITEEKRLLGKILFWDEQLSSDNTIACGSCHDPAHGGMDSRVGINPGLDGVFGTLDDVRAELQRFVDLGVNHLLLNPIDEFEEQLELLGPLMD